MWLNRRRLRLLVSTSPITTARKVRTRVAVALVERRRRRHDRTKPTFGPPRAEGLSSRLGTVDVGLLGGGLRPLREVATAYVDHRFDLLGSGWTNAAHGHPARGVEGYVYPSTAAVDADPAGAWLDGRVNGANLQRAQEVWAQTSAGYRPIDWQADLKSGFRWSELTWSGDITYGDHPGVDVKVPWELARMHHLPQLALAALAADAGHEGFGPPERWATEVQDEILDFIATNPPHYGVNWTCAMDVGIRAVNWLVAWDLLCSAGCRPPEAFEATFTGSLHDHARHIVDYLEWSPELRSNHYLADLVGLLFVAAYLPATDESDGWLGFAVRELLAETQDQFLPDGGSFEASTSYHRLSLELVLYATALAEGLPPERLARAVARRWVPERAGPRPAVTSTLDASAWRRHHKRIDRALAFSRETRRPDGTCPQIGDNDSGRLLKLTPVWRWLDAATWAGCLGADPGGPGAWFDDLSDHAHLDAAGAGFAPPSASRPDPHALETSLIRALRGADGASTVSVAPARPVSPRDGAPSSRTGGTERTVELRPAAPIELPSDVVRFEDFGAYVYRSANLFLIVRCGSIGQRGNGGHAHNDQLAFELVLHGEDWVVDPGTYLYTPLPSRRNAHRSVRAHSSPFTADEQAGDIGLGLFRLGDELRSEVVVCEPWRFVATCQGPRVDVERTIDVEPDGVSVTDRWWGADLGAGGTRVIASAADALDAWGPPPPYSPGYGWRLQCPLPVWRRALGRGAR